jgi:uncharacterized membrane protein (UPF0127 family)
VVAAPLRDRRASGSLRVDQLGRSWTRLEFLIPRSLVALLAVSLFLPAASVSAELPRIELTAGFYRIEAEVAANDPHRAQGLMHRRSMPANHGMLFVFAQAARHCMWMRHTYLPLSVAFLDEQGRILNIEEMQPETEDNHCAVKDARFALEMNRGWFSAKGIKAGARIGGVDKSPTPP